MSWESVNTWFLSLGEKHRVDPIIFGVIYITAIPIFWISVIWLIRNVRTKRSINFPIAGIILSHALPYGYLVIAGRNLSWWAYTSIGILVVFALAGLVIKIRKILKPKPE